MRHVLTDMDGGIEYYLDRARIPELREDDGMIEFLAPVNMFHDAINFSNYLSSCQLEKMKVAPSAGNYDNLNYAMSLVVKNPYGNYFIEDDLFLKLPSLMPRARFEYEGNLNLDALDEAIARISFPREKNTLEQISEYLHSLSLDVVREPLYLPDFGLEK